MKRLLLIPLFLLAACGLDHGTITDKTYEPDASFFMPMTICSNNSCSTYLQYYYIPECYHLWFTDGKDKGDACVSRNEWDKFQRGDYYGQKA